MWVYVQLSRACRRKAMHTGPSPNQTKTPERTCHQASPIFFLSGTWYALVKASSLSFVSSCRGLVGKLGGVGLIVVSQLTKLRTR